MSGLILPPGVEVSKRDRKHKQILVSVVELIPDDEKDEESKVFCDILGSVNIGLIRAKTDVGKMVIAAYAIPEEERKDYYIADLDGNKRYADINEEPFALCELREFFQGVQADMMAMTEGDQLISGRMGIVTFLLHGACDNPIYEPKIMEGRIKVLFMRVP